MFSSEGCPNCTSIHIYRSHRKPYERIFLFFLTNWTPHRCNECGRRFYLIQRDV